MHQMIAKRLIAKRLVAKQSIRRATMKKACKTRVLFYRLRERAEREGFEPSVPFRGHSISSAAQSAALPPLLRKCKLTFWTAFFGRFLRALCFSPSIFWAKAVLCLADKDYSAAVPASRSALRFTTSALFASVWVTAAMRRRMVRILAFS